MENKPEIIFADGLMWKDPNEKAPSFIKGELLFNATKFDEFMKNNMQYATEKGWLKVVMKESRTGSIYFALDTWKPTKQESTTRENTDPNYPQDSIDADQIPF